MTEFDDFPNERTIEAFQREMQRATNVAEGFGRAMTKAFDGAIVRGRDFGDVLRSLALQLSSMAIGAALKPIGEGFGKLFEQFLGGSLSVPTAVQPFASGGAIATPGYFRLGAMAGEQRAEAMLPLGRGTAGIRPQGEARPLAVTVNISTPDAASFRRSEAYLSGSIARAVARGERNL
jgi:phage-related minor tail protein